MSNKFWAAANSSSEGENDSDNDSVNERELTQKQVGGRFGGTYLESDSESDDEVRVVKSVFDRTWGTIREGISKLKNARKNNDWPQIQDEFESVNKMIDKSKMVIIQQGLPNFYIKMLAEVEDHVQLALKDKEGVKKMKPVVARALNQMKLKVRKHNEKYKVEIADFREHPENEDDLNAKKTTKKVPAKAAALSDDEDSLFGDEEDDESSEDDVVDTKLTGRAKWLKKPSGKEKTAKSRFEEGAKVEVVNRESGKWQTGIIKRDRGDGSYDVAFDDGSSEFKVTENLIRKAIIKKVKIAQVTESSSSRTQNILIEENISEEVLDKKVNELVASRGKKNTDPREVLRQLEVLSKAARLHGPRKEIPVLMHLISSMFDSHRNIDDYMELNQWRTCLRSLNRIMVLLDANKKLSLGIMQGDEVTDLVLAASKLGKKIDEEATAESKASSSDEKFNIKVVGSVESFILRLEDEYTKSLQQINPHTQEYVIRLSDEATLLDVAESVLLYYKRILDFKAAANVSLLIIEHTYYKHDSVATAVQRAHWFNKTWGKYGDIHPASVGKYNANNSKDIKIVHPASFLGNPTVDPPIINPARRIEELSSFIYKYGDERIKTRALLCSVYHHALHDRYYQARDLFLISHIQDFVDKADIKTQILYNRSLATLGLCAFRQGFFQKAHDSLSSLCGPRLKELLAQGQMKWVEKDPEQEKIERRRQIPYHMHINPDLLECCHLTCAMILELPQLARRTAAPGSAIQQNVISKQFRKYFQSYGKQVFTGPPENTREHVLAATKALLVGEWQKAAQYITGLEVWNLIPNEGGEAVKKMLRNKIKEESIRTYLLIHSDHYESLSLTHLCEMFDTEPALTRKIVCRMIFNKELSAAWDIPSDILVMYKSDLNALQILSKVVADKVSLLLESNERILDPLVGVYGYRDDPQRGDQRRGGWNNYNQDGQDGQQRKRVPYRNPNLSNTQPHGGGGGRGRGGRGRGGRGGGRSGSTGGGSGGGGPNNNAWKNNNAPRKWASQS
eukprot:gene9697-13053_t